MAIIFFLLLALGWALLSREGDEARRGLPPVEAAVDQAASGGCGLVFWVLLGVVFVALALGTAPVIAVLATLEAGL